MRFFVIFALALATAATPGRTLAQQTSTQPPAQPDHFYRLNFSIEQVGDNGKITNSRSYTTTAETGPNDRYGKIRAGNRVPIHTSSNTVIYLDVGVNIDANQAKETDGRLALLITAEISSVSNASGGDPDTPLVRQNRWNGPVIVPIGKPMVIFSSDNLDNKGKMQVELTATRIE